jgi:hypothetical protein
MDNDNADVACGLVDRGMGSNSDRYVIHIFDSKSLMNPDGHPPSSTGLSYASDEEKLLDIESGGVSGAFVGGFGG